MNSATALASTLIDELVHQGVVELVLCPGSRSAPLAFAAAAAQRAGRLRLHVRVDERSAGFLALGLAKVSGLPVPVVCTSGSAVANLTPAVVEASYSSVPLVALTADRPVEARGIGSPQTIDQFGIFASNVRYARDLGADRVDPEDTAQLARMEHEVRGAVAGAVAAAIGADGGHPAVGTSGPVQLNVGFRVPLVPPVPQSQLGTQAAAAHPRRPRRPPLARCGCQGLEQLVGTVPQRGIIVAGDLPVGVLREQQQWLAQLAADLGWPIICEPTANLHGSPTALDHGVLLAGTPGFLAEHLPEMVISAGMFGLSRPTIEVLRGAGRHVALDLGTSREVCDPARTARQVLTAIPMAPRGFVQDREWLAQWQAADRAVSIALGRADLEFTGIAVAREVAASVPGDGLLLAAASWPVRHLEAFAGLTAGVRVIGNRGTNGIDGLVSTAWGAALAHQRLGGGPAVALLGDLALLHDHNGLLAPPGAAEPDLTVVVVDNNGGGIFHQLEQGRPAYETDFELLFGTPHGLDLVEVAAATGRPTFSAGSVAELTALLREPNRGVRVIIARVLGRDEEAAQLVKLRSLASARIG